MQTHSTTVQDEQPSQRNSKQEPHTCKECIRNELLKGNGSAHHLEKECDTKNISQYIGVLIADGMDIRKSRGSRINRYENHVMDTHYYIDHFYLMVYLAGRVQQ